MQENNMKIAFFVQNLFFLDIFGLKYFEQSEETIFFINKYVTIYDTLYINIKLCIYFFSFYSSYCDKDNNKDIENKSLPLPPNKIKTSIFQ